MVSLYAPNGLTTAGKAASKLTTPEFVRCINSKYDEYLKMLRKQREINENKIGKSGL